MLETITAVAVAALASSGFWAFLQKHGEKKDVRTRMLLGLAHDRILSLGMLYVARGYVTRRGIREFERISVSAVP